MEERELNPTQLRPTEAFSTKLNYQQVATMAISQANNVMIDCVAVFRGYSGVKCPLHTGDLC